MYSVYNTYTLAIYCVLPVRIPIYGINIYSKQKRQYHHLIKMRSYRRLVCYCLFSLSFFYKKVALIPTPTRLWKKKLLVWIGRWLIHFSFLFPTVAHSIIPADSFFLWKTLPLRERKREKQPSVVVHNIFNHLFYIYVLYVRLFSFVFKKKKKKNFCVCVCNENCARM